MVTWGWVDCAVWRAATTALVMMAFSCSAESVIWPESEDSVEGSWSGRADILLLGEGREASKVEGEVTVEGE